MKFVPPNPPVGLQSKHSKEQKMTPETQGKEKENENWSDSTVHKYKFKRPANTIVMKSNSNWVRHVGSVLSLNSQKVQQNGKGELQTDMAEVQGTWISSVKHNSHTSHKDSPFHILPSNEDTQNEVSINTQVI